MRCLLLVFLTACGAEHDTARPRPHVEEVAHPLPALLVGGGEHMCAREEGGPLRCWGRNDEGELGDGTRNERPTPTAATMADHFVSIAIGGAHACGLDTEGTVSCWGANLHGQLGDGTLVARASAAVVDHLPPVAELGAGTDHTCARTREGAVYCWGDDEYLEVGSELGTGADVLSSREGNSGVIAPRLVTLPAPADRLFVHASLNCAQLTTRALFCWGGAWLVGWLGDERYTHGREPIEVPELARAEEIALGSAFVCGRLAGRVHCFGEHLDGQLGDPDGDCCAEPPRAFDAAGVSDAIAIAAADRHACALRRSGEVMCWGTGLPAAPGDQEERGVARPRLLIEHATAIAAGSTHVCARVEQGVACFGDDTYGQLGDGVSRRVPRAVRVDGIDDAAQLGMGIIHTCISSRAHGVSCWGADERRHVAPLDAGTGLIAGTYESCAVTDEREATCTSRGAPGFGGELAGVVTFDFPIASLSAGPAGMCALGRGGEIACTEEYSDAHVIRFETPPRTARRIERGRGASYLSVDARACAVIGSSVWCWRSESPTQSGAVGHVAGAPAQIALDAGNPPVGVAAGEDLECAWTRAGHVWCWTLGLDVGQPARVPGLEGVLEVAIGRAHACARTADAVSCWGEGEHGQLGGGELSPDAIETPIRVVDLPSGAVQIDAAGDRSCARLAGGDVYCWGDDEENRLGRDVPPAPRGPVVVSG